MMMYYEKKTGQSNSGSDGFDYDVKQEGKEYKRVERNVGGVG